MFKFPQITVTALHAYKVIFPLMEVFKMLFDKHKQIEVYWTRSDASSLISLHCNVCCGITFMGAFEL